MMFRIKLITCVFPFSCFVVQINLGMYIKDKTTELSLLVDRASGGSSIVDGELEVMLHRLIPEISSHFLIFSPTSFEHYDILSVGIFCRRLLKDDGRGVAEALNETVCTPDGCTGLTVSNFKPPIKSLDK